MKNTCNGLAVIVGLLGFIGSIWLAFNLGGNWFKAILCFILGCLLTAMVTVIFMGIAEILEKLEDLGYKMGEIRKTVNEMRDSNSEIPEDKWKCSKCGRLNENYTGSCACGASRY